MNNNMRIIFLETPSPWLVRKQAQIPLGILYLATVLKKNNYDVCIQRPCEISDLKCVEEYDIIGLSGTTLEYPMNVQCAKWIKKRYPKKIILLGGSHATVMGDEIVKENCFDSVCLGEGENTILQITKDIQSNSLKKIYKNDRYIEDLDLIPIPDRSLITGTHGGDIFAFRKNYIGTGNENILTSRGCSFKCSFCASQSIWHRKVRFRSIDNVLKEVEYILNIFGSHQLRICDDNITSDPIRCRELCRTIIDRKFNIAWRCSVRAESLTQEISDIMFESGCKEISPGIESGDQRVLKFLDKNTTTEKMLIGCTNARNSGIKIRALMMIGTPGENLDTPEINNEYLNILPHDIITLSTFIPLPGTAIWKSPDKYNCQILSRDFNKYNKDYWIFKDGECRKREYTPLIHNKNLSIEQQIDNVRRMEKYVESRKYNKG